MSTHRHTLGHEHEYEPERGLPEALPTGERLLWQGSPSAAWLFWRSFHGRTLSAYFALLVVLRGVFAWQAGEGAWAVVQAMAGGALLAAAGLALLGWLAWFSARTTVYTLTDRRVVMRIGIVLTVTFNLPLSRIAGADVKRLPRGHGEVALALAMGPGERIAWLHLWPHVRPWKLAAPQPMLRALPDAEAFAARLTAAWQAAGGRPDAMARPVPRPALQQASA
jgi:hypothetical protein